MKKIFLFFILGILVFTNLATAGEKTKTKIAVMDLKRNNVGNILSGLMERAGVSFYF